ncbi:hypothetical protein [Cerasibacillus terrae]|nr:hypothetical protein [Cerasibacillus terrae]
MSTIDSNIEQNSLEERKLQVLIKLFAGKKKLYDPFNYIKEWGANHG